MRKIYRFLIVSAIVVTLVIGGFSVYSYACIRELDSTLITNKSLLSNFDSEVNFYDVDNNLLEQTSASGKTITKLSELPDYVKNAFISIEDKEFYSHNGLNIRRILKATLNNLLSGYAKEGASTISQQLIKNTHLTSDKTLKRKIQEAYLTTQLEAQYDKDEILETYLNVIYFGNGAVGIERASQVFFDCSASELSIAQSATLAGVIKSPSYYSPVNNPENCLTRRNTVLKEMLNDGYITEDEYQEAVTLDLGISLQESVVNANCFYQQTIQEAQKILNLSEKDVALSNFKIYTYLDSDLQNSITDDFQYYLNKANKNKKIDGVLTVLDNETLGVKALISTTASADVKRQPASLMKPILCYAPAFDLGLLSPLSPLDDSSITFGDWTPENVNGTTEGWITTRNAISESKNIVAVKVLDYVTLEKAKKYAGQLGIEFVEEDNHLALALGAMRYGISPLQMSACYATFANGGSYGDCKLIRKIEDLNGNVLYEHSPAVQQVFSEDTAYLINNVLEDTATTGTAKKLSNLSMKLSAKTGTVGTQNNSRNTDAWCVSYNPEWTVCAWVGNLTSDSSNNLSKEQNGGTIGANLNKVAWEVLKTTETNTEFTKPETVKSIKADALDWNEKHLLKLASEKTPERFVLSDLCSEKYIPDEESSRFTEITPPVLSVKKEGEQAVLTWNTESFLKYDIYENDELYDKDCETPYSVPANEGGTRYYVIAKNQFSEVEQSSNTVTLYIQPSKVKEEIKEEKPIKKVTKHWLFS